MKKRILIVSHGLEIGGAESSLIGYLHALAKKEDVQTDLFLYKHTGELMKHIPKEINLLPQNNKYACLATPVKNVIMDGHFLILAGRFLGKVKSKRYIKEKNLQGNKSSVSIEYSHKYTKCFMPKISNDEYDLAVSFLTPHYFVSEKVQAKKKVAFIHTDYSYIVVDKESELKMWDAFDTIAAVSPSVADSFIKLFPSLSDKVSVVENIIPTELVKSMSAEFIPEDEMPNDGRLKILSIGRFCDAKNFESIPFKVKLLKEFGLKVKWYIIGYGDASLINKAIDQNDCKNDVIILGKKVNPYPYIKLCDIYAQPSRYEGKSVTVLEAQILGKPVIISDYATADSQLKNGFDGIIAPMNDNKFVNSLKSLILDRKLQLYLSDNCASSDYSNSIMADKLINLV